MVIELNQPNDDELKNMTIDLIWKAIDGSIKLDQLASALNEKKEKNKEFESLVADVISIIDVEIGSLGTNTNIILSSNDESFNLQSKKEKFYSVVNSLRSIVGDEILKERLEIETLESLKLIAKKEVFNQKYVKIKTRLFYKQQKFNLLREETEGYSKLITELGQNNLDNKVLENIQSLIGCFNLDPNRVLDIILESFENSPVMFKTFIGLLKHYKAEDDTICQIVGFKFQSLNQQQIQQQAKTDSKQDQPELDHISLDSLYKITSYLLKYNIIDLDSLMPHLYPNEQQIIQSYKEEFDSARQYAKKLITINLADSNSTQTDTGGNQQQQQQDDKINQQLQQALQATKIDNQKVNLVKNLIEIGDYKTALKIIEKLPQWYIASYSDITVSICKSIDENLIDPIYKKYNLMSSYLKNKYLNKTKKSSSSNKVNLAQTSDVEMENSAQFDSDDILSSFLDVILPILSALGPGVSYDAILFTKLIRICVSFLEMKKLGSSSSSSFNTYSVDQQNKESTPPPPTLSQIQQEKNTISANEILATFSTSELSFYNQIYTILNEVLLPSLSMISMNPCLAIELWNLLKLFPYEMRYHLYNNWRLNTYKHFPKLIKLKADCTEKIKYLLKRLTKENVKIHGRQIGKLSHNNPIIVCDYILTQIQRYDNFILPVVDSLKFMTPLSYDVLSYCIIIAMSDGDKDKMKHDSTNLSTWLQSIATFCALTFKKYPIELIAMIQYVINQLKNRKSYDLLILQEIVQKMCGIEVLSEVNDLQLEAMAGGDLLRQEAGYFNPIRNIKKCANRLKEALADHGLILPLCILLSQQRDFIVFSDQAEREKEMFNTAEKRHLKLTGCLYDQCQDSLVQFSQFLSSTLTTEEYIHIFPKIDVLVNDYHVSPDIAFFLSRPMYAHHIQSKYDEFRRIDRNSKTAEKPSKTQRYLESIDIVMQPVIDLARSLHPIKIWEDMSPLFYTTFWTLSMSDCFVPVNAYEKQRISLKQKLNALDDNVELTSTKKKKEKEKLLNMLDRITEEENKQRDHVQHVKARFEKEKDFWFPQKNRTKNETITVFLQLCIFSRCLFTQIDAYYCSKFIQIIHSLKTPNFSTIICYDRIFSDISCSIASLTDNEARRYGRFLLGLLETVMSWHADPNTFENECAQHPGFVTVFRNVTNNPPITSNRQEQLDYENFRHVCHKWHYKLTKSFIVCIESKEYLQMRNSLIILTKILPHYPKLTNFAAALEKRVESIKQVEKDKRQDIYTLASAYLGQLKLRKSHLVDEGKFHIKKQSTPAPGSTNEPNKNQSISATTTSTSKQQSNQSQSKHNTTAQSSDNSKFKQPLNPNKSSSSGSSSNSSFNPSSSSSSSKQQSSSTANNSTSTSNVSQSNSASSSSSSTSKTSESNKYNNDSIKSDSGNKSSNIRSSSSNKENSSSTSLNNPTESSSSQNTNGSTRIVISKSDQSPPSKSNDETTKSTSQNGSKGSKRAASSNSPNQQQLTPLTPTKNGNGATNDGYSPTSSVSSDDWPQSPKRANTNQDNNQSGSNHHNHSHHSQSNNNHSRSSSPSNKQSNHHSNSNRSNSTSSSDKTKRTKFASSQEESSANNNSSSSKNYNNGNNYSESYQQSGQSNSSSSSSTKRKPSRDRDRLERDRNENKDNISSRDKEKKEHRKREHSSDLNSDIQHKRSKSDEAKKKTNSNSSSNVSSSSSSSSNQQQNSSSQSSSAQNSSSNSKRSSKKHESSSSTSYNNPNNNDYQILNNSPVNNSSNNNNSNNNNNNSSKPYRSGDDRRSAHDKNSSYNSYKDKK